MRHGACNRPFRLMGPVLPSKLFDQPQGTGLSYVLCSTIKDVQLRHRSREGGRWKVTWTRVVDEMCSDRFQSLQKLISRTSIHSCFPDSWRAAPRHALSCAIVSRTTVMLGIGAGYGLQSCPCQLQHLEASRSAYCRRRDVLTLTLLCGYRVVGRPMSAEFAQPNRRLGNFGSDGNSAEAGSLAC